MLQGEADCLYSKNKKKVAKEELKVDHVDREAANFKPRF